MVLKRLIGRASRAKIIDIVLDQTFIDHEESVLDVVDYNYKTQVKGHKNTLGLHSPSRYDMSNLEKGIYT